MKKFLAFAVLDFALFLGTAILSSSAQAQSAYVTIQCHDTNNPQINSQSTDSLSLESGNVTCTATAFSGIASGYWQASYNGGPFQYLTGVQVSVSGSGISYGTYQVRIVGTDANGNPITPSNVVTINYFTSSSAQAQAAHVTIQCHDTNNPQINSQNTDSLSLESGNVTCTAAAFSGIASGYWQASYNGGPFQYLTGAQVSVSGSGISYGTYQIRIIGTDANGNPITPSNVVTINYDGSVGASGSGGGSSDNNCIVVTGYNDGCTGAPTPAGAIQYPNLLKQYTSGRPPWNVAGVDYYVGMPAGITLTPWQSIVSPGVGLDTTTGVLYCNSGAVTLDKIDFSANGGSFQYIYAPPGGCTSLTITNSKFGCPSTGSYHLIYLNTPVNFTLKYNTMNWTGCESSGWQGGNQDTLLISNGPAGSTGVIQYNYIAHTANHPFSVAGVSSYDFRYNFLDNVAYDNKVGNHMNYMQMFGNNSNVTWAYNTTYQSATCCETGGEGPQFYSNGGGTLTNAIFANNTMVATGGNMSYMVHGAVNGNGMTVNGTLTDSQNYFDPTGTTDGNSNGIYYPGSMVAPWVSSGNINMLNGSIVTPQ